MVSWGLLKVRRTSSGFSIRANSTGILRLEAPRVTKIEGAQLLQIARHSEQATLLLSNFQRVSQQTLSVPSLRRCHKPGTLPSTVCQGRTKVKAPSNMPRWRRRKTGGKHAASRAKCLKQEAEYAGRRQSKPGTARGGPDQSPGSVEGVAPSGLRLRQPRV